MAFLLVGCAKQFESASPFRSKLEDGAVFLSIERFCAVEGDGKELAKL